MYMKKVIIPFLVFAISLYGVFYAQNLSVERFGLKTDTYSDSLPIIIVDAGHGGIDGGTSAPDGTIEKDLNLSISFKLKTFLEGFGFKVIMTRTTDNLIGDNSLPTIRERKRSDVNKRLEIINNTFNSLTVSIHQNYFTASEYNGTQVFYSPNNDNSYVLAEKIQNSTVSMLQKDNKRKIKPCGKDIFLMYKANNPAVMVECGFLSNYEEYRLLKDNVYQNKIAFCIAIGILDFYG